MRGVIAGGHPRTCAAGVEALDAGGNAVDAAVAAVLTSFVAEPLLSSAGGGGVLLLKLPDATPLVLDFFPRAPRDLSDAGHRDFDAVDVDFGETVQRFHVGRASAAMPFTLRALVDLQRRWGRVPLRAVLAPAIDAAREGVALGESGAEVFSLLWPIVTKDPDAVTQLAGGSLPAADQRVRNPAFAALLEALCSDDTHARDQVFTSIDRAILDGFGPARGGVLTSDDVVTRLPEPVEAPCVEHQGWRFWTADKPGGQAVRDVLTGCLGRDLSSETALTRHLARAVAAADPAANLPVHPPGSTTHISVLDETGAAVSVTTSNGEGCGYLIPGTGILLNNFLGEADLNPGGFFRHAPGQPLPTMMAPTIAAGPEGDLFVLGSGGANRIRSAVSSTLLRLTQGSALTHAVDAPRLHAEGTRCWYETVGWHDEGAVRDAISAAYPAVTSFARRAFFFGGVHAVRRAADGTLEGCGDARRAGASAHALG